MKHLLLSLVIVFLTGCNTKVIMDGESRIRIDDVHVVNPVIEFCERLYPEVLYPNEIEREIGITECMKLCSEGSQCSVDIPDFLNEQGVK